MAASRTKSKTCFIFAKVSLRLDIQQRTDCIMPCAVKIHPRVIRFPAGVAYIWRQMPGSVLSRVKVRNLAGIPTNNNNPSRVSDSKCELVGITYPPPQQVRRETDAWRIKERINIESEKEKHNPTNQNVCLKNYVEARHRQLRLST